MKMVKDIKELKKGDTIIIKDCPAGTSLGLKSISGDIYSLEADKTYFTIKCKETEKFENISLEDGVIFLIG